tara:strand:- start:201 stop:368 length:168 start_codon:yes stop_codon:yes gene_type:complete
MENDDENINDLQKYLEQLSNVEKQIIETAKEVLGSSFNIQKSIGFQEWKKNQHNL